MYCVYFTIYSGDKLPPYYIGSTSKKKIEQGYHGTVSSRKWKDVWKEELKFNPHLFKTMIIQNNIADRNDALEAERKWQELLNSVRDERFANRVYAKGKFCNIDGTNNGKTFSDTHRRKIGIASSNRSEETLKKIREARARQILTPERNARIGNAVRGRPIPSLQGRVPWNKGLKTNGHPQTQETKDKIPQKHSDEAKEKMRKAKLGKPWTDARRAAMIRESVVASGDTALTVIA